MGICGHHLPGDWGSGRSRGVHAYVVDGTSSFYFVPLHISIAGDQKSILVRWNLTRVYPYQGVHLYPKQLHKEQIREYTMAIHPCEDIQFLLTFSVAFIIIGNCLFICLLPYPNRTGKATGARILSVWFSPVSVPCIELGT